MGDKSLFVERSGSAVCLFINQITSLRKWMLNEMKKPGTKPRSAKRRNNGNQTVFNSHTFIYDAPFII